MPAKLDQTIWTPGGVALLRIVVGLLFLSHGLVKLFGFPEGAEPGRMPLLSLFGFGGLLELVGGALFCLGLFTRPTAFLLSGEMAVAYFMFHAPKSFFPVVNGGDAAILYSFIFLFFVLAGPSQYSIDEKLRHRTP